MKQFNGRYQFSTTCAFQYRDKLKKKSKKNGEWYKTLILKIKTNIGKEIRFCDLGFNCVSNFPRPKGVEYISYFYIKFDSIA